jgi:DNA-3-methyladenine glycosylase II
VSKLDPAAHIVKADPAFRRIVETGPPMEFRSEDGSAFESLLSAIVSQQLAGAAARAIHGRLVIALGGAPVAPESVLAADPGTLRAAGLSANKLAAIIDLAAKFADGTIPTHDLDDLSDDEIVARLVTVRGVGPWTAEMFLLFQLHRPDVWPVDDLGVRNGWARIHEMAAPPSPKALQILGDVLRPYRSTAAWYCWRAVASVPIVAAPRRGEQARAQSRGSTITFPPEEGVISSSKTSGT